MLVSKETIAAFYKSRVPAEISTRADLRNETKAGTRSRALSPDRARQLRGSRDQSRYACRAINSCATAPAITEFPKTLKLSDFGCRRLPLRAGA